MTDGRARPRTGCGALLPAEAREPLERGLAPTDLQTLLLSVARARAQRVTPHRLLARWREDHFVRPSRMDPRLLARVEPVLWAALPARFTGVGLSPLAPLGCCSTLGPVHQNRVATTGRGSEVVSDPTNALAVEAVARRSAGAPGPVHHAACARVVRAQAFDGPGLSAHFQLFAGVTPLIKGRTGFMEIHKPRSARDQRVPGVDTRMANPRG